MFRIILLCAFVQGYDATIYRLDGPDYARMPALMHMDPYELCQLDTDALYCSAEFVLVSDKPSPLLDMIMAYSDHHVTHYNRTHLRYGICVTQTCKKFYDKENRDLKFTLEACLNETLSEKYELKVKILDEYYCRRPGTTETDIDLLDILVAVICLILLFVNIVGSLCDFYYTRTENAAVRILLCFSVKRNWKKLINPASEGRDPRLQLLKSVHGVRVMTIALVIIGHSSLVSVVAIKNPEFVEQVYTVKPFYILLNGTLIMQTFLMISAFLLVYNWLIHSETHPISWNMLPKHIIIRWLRLTPSYAFILALTTTWFRYIATGPLWDKFVMAEMRDCRQYWWHHLLYINNYSQNTSCMVQSWYLAVDTQLYILAVIIYLTCRTTFSRKIMLSSLFVIATIATVAHTYYQDLDAILLISPETVLSLFFYDPYFNNVYKRTHTNIVGYVIGMAVGFLVYHMQKQDIDFKKIRTLPLRLLVWSTFPLSALVCYSGGIFYDDGSRPSIFIRIIYAILSKPMFTLGVSAVIVGSIFKIEDVYRSILECRWWVIPSRLSYSAYLLHVVLIRSYVASITEVTRQSYFTMLQLYGTMLVITFTVTFFFWMLVEAPFTNLIRECVSTVSRTKVEEKKKQNLKPAEELKEKVSKH